jgi:outer membrane immunogenic protein
MAGGMIIVPCEDGPEKRDVMRKSARTATPCRQLAFRWAKSLLGTCRYIESDAESWAPFQEFDQVRVVWRLLRRAATRMVPMKKLLLATTALVAFAAGAQAADLGAPRMPIAAAVVAPAFSWSGFYGGLHVGYGWGRMSGQFFNAALVPQAFESSNPRGIFGGLQAGYNWQRGNVVLGVETDIAMASLSARGPLATNPAFALITRMNWLGSTRLRAGIAADKALFYVTGGLAYGGTTTSVPVAPGVTTSKTRIGFALGAGLEYALTTNVTAKVEYMYYNFGTTNYTVSLGNEFIRITPQAHTVKLGVNYLFSTGPSAVVARY